MRSSGDFFGGVQGHASVVVDVVAVSDVEVLAIDPLHITHLTADHHRHTVMSVLTGRDDVEWFPRRHRRRVLVGA